MNATLSATPNSERALSLALVIGLHAAAGAGLLALAQPVIQQMFAEPVQIELINANSREQTAPEPPKPMPMKQRPTPQRQQVAPQTIAPPLLQTTAPASADSPVISAAPVPKEAAPASAAPTEASARPGPAVSEAVQAPRHDADYLLNPKPEYPRASRSLGEEGKVWLRVQVSEDGRPLQTLVDTSSGYQRLDRAARDTVASSWRFDPARQGGKPVVGWVRFAIHFELNR